ncbi:uncharacterized protein [Bemisia tabaci]|uniref:uncharacterized protein isoform X1 n=1 Tax=Bemisia tabaci TaxID=7038 RepID=UPI003B283DD0
MSLLDKLTDSKKNLKSTETKFIQTDGSVFIESRSETGFAKIPTSDTSHGFIIDLKPDLQVAEILPWLFFGSQDVACDRSLLLQHRITHILSLVLVCMEKRIVLKNHADDHRNMLLINIFFQEERFSQHSSLCINEINTCKVEKQMCLLMPYLRGIWRQRHYEHQLSSTECLCPSNGINDVQSE